MKRPRKAVRIGAPALVIGLLTLAALWRVGTPPKATIAVAPADVRPATLEHVRLRSLPSPRTAWIEADPIAPGQPADTFAVLDPDVKRPVDLDWAPGSRVTLIGLVRPAPDTATAVRQWGIDQATADDLKNRGTYLHVTEIRP